MFLISFVICAYNAEDYIGECLDSIINSNSVGYKIIIINDGSCDATSDIIDYYVSKYDFISTCFHENKGLGYSRNIGVNLVDTELFTFVDADDVVISDVVLFVKNVKIEFDILTTNLLRFKSKSELLLKNNTLNYNKVDKSFFENKKYYSCGRIYKKYIFKNILFPNFYYEDLATIPLLIEKSNNVISNFIFYGYRNSEDSIVNTITKKHLELSMSLSYLLESSKSNFIKSIYTNEIIGLFVLCLKSENESKLLFRKELYKHICNISMKNISKNKFGLVLFFLKAISFTGENIFMSILYYINKVYDFFLKREM